MESDPTRATGPTSATGPAKASEATKRRRPWRAVLVAFLLFAVGLFLGGVATRAFTSSPFSSSSEERNSQIVRSISREKQVVLLALGIQGIAERTGKSQFYGVDIPGSERASFLQYSFDAKLGIEGKDVHIRSGDANEIVVSMPRFIFIGHDNYRFRMVAENNGALSWFTPANDPVQMINNILTDESKAQYVQNNREFLEEQARGFYTGIITSVDPTLTVRFEFPN